MTFDAFEQAIEEAIDTIPKEFRNLLDSEGIEIIARDVVPERVHELFPNKVVFGIFAGVARNQRNVFAVQLEPTRIEIYQESFEEVYGPTPSPEIKAQIVRTVIHEVAHYMGFNEEEVRERGY